MAVTPGLSGRLTTTVTAGDTAEAVGSGDVPVLATPRVVALVEGASVAALDGALDAGRTSVGTRIVLSHDEASAVGAELSVHAELVDVDGPRLTFYVAAYEGERIVASGEHTRVVVDRDRFVDRASGR